MTDTTFVDKQGTVNAAWLNDVNQLRYGAASATRGAALLQFISQGSSPATRTAQDKMREWVSIKDFGGVADNVTDNSTALTNALATGVDVYFPYDSTGIYAFASKVSLNTSGQRLFTDCEHGVVLRATSAITLLESQINVENLRFERLSFDGAGATGVGTASTGGAFHDYMIAPTFESCHFYSNLAFGIKSDLIKARVEKCSFGYYSNGAWAAGMVGVKSFSNAANYTNLNAIRDCIFKCGNGATVYSIDLSGGNFWLIENCDFEQGGAAIRADYIGNLMIRNCWFESLNCGAGQVINLTPSGSAAGGGVYIDTCNFASNTSAQQIQWQSSVLQSIEIVRSNFALLGDYPVLDGTTINRGILGSGQLRWRDNYVSGANAANRLSTGQNKGIQNDVRGWAIINSAGAGSITASSDPNLSISRTGTGVIVITWSHNNGTTSSGVCVIASGQGTITTVGAAAANTCTVTCKTDAGVAADDTFHVIVLGK